MRYLYVAGCEHEPFAATHDAAEVRPSPPKFLGRIVIKMGVSLYGFRKVQWCKIHLHNEKFRIL